MANTRPWPLKVAVLAHVYLVSIPVRFRAWVLGVSPLRGGLEVTKMSTFEMFVAKAIEVGAAQVLPEGTTLAEFWGLSDECPNCGAYLPMGRCDCAREFSVEQGEAAFLASIGL